MSGAGRIEIVVEGTPVPQDRRTKIIRRRDGTSFAGTYLLKTTREWRQRILWRARQTPGYPETPWTGPVFVSIEAFFERPQEMLRPKYPDGPILKNTKPDADNLVKSTLDALTPPRLKRGMDNPAIRDASRRGYLWIDDSYVHLKKVIRYYAARGAGPGLVIVAERIVEGSETGTQGHSDTVFGTSELRNFGTLEHP